MAGRAGGGQRQQDRNRGKQEASKNGKKGGGKTKAGNKPAYPIQELNAASIHPQIAGVITTDPSVEVVIQIQDEKLSDRNHVTNRRTRMVKRGREPFIERR